MGNSLFYWLIDNVIPWILSIILIALASILFIGSPLLGYALYAQARSPVFTLYKNQWTCSADHIETSTTYVYTGSNGSGVAMPITSHNDVCDRYERKK